MEFGIYPNIKKQKIYQYLPKLIKILENQQVKYFVANEVKSKLEEKHIYINPALYKTTEWMGTHLKHILSVGGDGSYLESAKIFSDYEVFLTGIHLGELGFLNSIKENDTESKISQLIKQDYVLEERLFLEATILNGEDHATKLPVVLNDVVIGKNQIGKMIRLKLWINDNFAQQYPCDGLIISTPTGSTGYAFSCGGPILHSAAQEMIVVPICPHTLAKFSSVLSEGDIVKITLSDREEILHISMDGNGSYDLKKGETLVVQGIRKKIRFVRFKDQDFWEMLSDKLVKKI